VIAITASSPAEEEHGLRNQFTGFLRKPFTRRALFHELAGFLPRARVNSAPARHHVVGVPANPSLSFSAPNGTNQASAPAEAASQTWKTLVPELRTMQATEWPALRDSLAISATQAFARKLHNLGQTRSCGPLTAYAGKLGADAESYSIRELRAHLLEFPTLIQSIEQNG
jgi:hypothetical protein